MTPIGDTRPIWRTVDGVDISGCLLAADAPRRDVALVIAHGFSASAADDHVTFLAMAAAARGFDAVTYDARGHGTSGGECTLGDDEQHDVERAVAFAATIAERVVLVGASMGAIAVLRHAAAAPDTAVTGVVALSCPARWQLPLSPTGIASMLLTRTRLGRVVAARHVGVRLASRFTWPTPPVALAAALPLPLAVVHGAADRFISPRAAHELHAAAGGPRRIDIVAGLGHAYGPLAVAPVLEAVEWVLAPG